MPHEPVTSSMLEDLVARLDQQRHAYTSCNYNETQTRREFLDPLFGLLGWDVDNRQGYAEQYKDVVHEDSIRVGGVLKAPDYCFRIGGVRKFFVEAKRPYLHLKQDAAAAFQLRRYAWSAKLPLSILTNFAEFCVYDCRHAPDKNDPASTARVLYLTAEDYAREWHQIADVFARESILKGSFDQFASATSKRMRGTSEVDSTFLHEIERWREALARHLALRNTALTVRELNFAVQRTIDRIVFLRICEDRAIERYGQLQALLDGVNTYARLTEMFLRADDRYNSGLFHFRNERNRADLPDTLTLDLKIDDKVLKDMLKRLYYPDSPYEFSVLPADILGQVYEQFLGKVIRLTASHQARTEEKPEVKKAGGVFYTPSYIVEHMVARTLSPLFDGKTLKQVVALRILDPACGSGSFLVAAYQYLLDWHLTQYLTAPEKHSKGRSPVLVRTTRGWRLTTQERKRILLSSIFGVDIDVQAVEVTKLCLLLKVLEGESEESLSAQLSLLHERALPDLGDNIRCGNSLVGPDYFSTGQLDLLPEGELQRVNAFDWHSDTHGFGAIMKRGGFDAVLGNPPYVDIKGLDERDVSYLFSNFRFSNNRVNLFAAFIEKSLSLVRASAFRFSMIVPTALLTQDSYKKLRAFILRSHRVDQLVRLPNESFGTAAGDVKVDTVVVTLAPEGRAKTEVIAFHGYNRIAVIEPAKADYIGTVSQAEWLANPDHVWSLATSQTDSVLLSRCDEDALPLVSCAEFCLGLTPYDKYRGHTQSQIKGRAFHADHAKDNTFRRLLAGNDVSRYHVAWGGLEWISYGPWLGASRERRFFTEPRILVKQIIDWSSRRIWAAMTCEELYNTQNAFNLLPREGWDIEYLLGILNSSLMSYYHRKRFLDEGKMRFQKILVKDCKQFPIRRPTSANWPLRQEMSSLVRRMVDLQQRLQSAKLAQQVVLVNRQIEATDRQIDAVVYRLYGLAEQEIRTVEQALSPQPFRGDRTARELRTAAEPGLAPDNPLRDGS